MSDLQTKEKSMFEGMVGDLKVGRANLGPDMPVAAYRLFEFSIRDTLNELFGKEQCVEVLRSAGRKSGIEFTRHLLDTGLEFNLFISSLQQKLIEMKMGILRIEQVDSNGQIILTISEDLDCSGLPMTGETVCNYDEGFVQGILEEYNHKEYTAVEIDCWAKGDRVCRFKVSEKK